MTRCLSSRQERLGAAGCCTGSTGSIELTAKALLLLICVMLAWFGAHSGE